MRFKVKGQSITCLARGSEQKITEQESLGGLADGVGCQSVYRLEHCRKVGFKRYHVFFPSYVLLLY